jgi:hypothetical protein
MDRFDYAKIAETNIDSLRQSAARGRQLLQQITPLVFELGGIIAEVRDAIPHGFFGLWCTEALGIEHRTALNYSNLAKLAMNHDRSKLEKLSLSAAYRISAPSTPAAAVVEVLNRVAVGDIPTATTVKNLIRQIRQSQTPHDSDKTMQAEVEVIAGLLAEALNGPDLKKLKKFLLNASPEAVRALCHLDVTVPMSSAANVKLQNQWMLTS